MYNFQQKIPLKRYGKVTRGWNPGKIYQLVINNSKSNFSKQYIKADLEMLDDKFKDIIVPAFFYYNKEGKPDPKFIAMGIAAGLDKDYGKDLQSVFKDLHGKELMAYVVHKYKKGRIRRDQVFDFKPLPEPGSFG